MNFSKSTHTHRMSSDPPVYEQKDTLPHYQVPSETLPGYQPTHSYFGLALSKTEFLTPYLNNTGDRAWKPVVLELNSTQLNVHELCVDTKCAELILSMYNEVNSLYELLASVGSDCKPKKKVVEEEEDIYSDIYGPSIADLDAHQQYQLKHSYLDKLKYKKKKAKQAKSLASVDKYYDMLRDNRLLFEPVNCPRKWDQFRRKYKGKLLRSYTLANLRAGEAPSLSHLISQIFREQYHETSAIPPSTLIKYKNTLRVRLEHKQVLLQFWSFTAMTNWYRALEIGHDLSMPFDERTGSKLKSIPGRDSSRINELLTATVAAASYSNANVESYERDIISSSEKFSDSNEVNSLSSSLDRASYLDSIFDEGSTSIASNTSSYDGMSKPHAGTPSIRTTTTINKRQFVSFENWNTTLEKQYISNCIPKLNSFDKWHGKSVTLSNYSRFVTGQEEGNLYISPHDLALFQAGGEIDSFECRHFLIHTSGLVSVQKS